MRMWDEKEEAENLAKLFADVNREEFARVRKFKGGSALIYQHLTQRRPISLESAIAYADGFKIPLEQISPRIALEVKQAASRIGPSAVFPTNATQGDGPTIEDVLDLLAGFKVMNKDQRAIALTSARAAIKRTNAGKRRGKKSANDEG